MNYNVFLKKIVACLLVFSALSRTVAIDFERLVDACEISFSLSGNPVRAGIESCKDFWNASGADQAKIVAGFAVSSIIAWKLFAIYKRRENLIINARHRLAYALHAKITNPNKPHSIAVEFAAYAAALWRKDSKLNDLYTTYNNSQNVQGNAQRLYHYVTGQWNEQPLFCFC